MDISKLKSAELRSVIHLVETRDELVSKLEKVEDQIRRAFSGTGAASAPASAPVPPKPRKRSTRTRKAAGAGPKAAPAAKAPAAKAPAAKVPARGRRKGRRGALKASILAALTAAGAKGVSAKELSASLKMPNQNIHVWFSSTGKKIKEIIKKDGRWILKGPISTK